MGLALESALAVGMVDSDLDIQPDITATGIMTAATMLRDTITRRGFTIETIARHLLFMRRLRWFMPQRRLW
jgi:hypothetical protein